MKNIILIYDFLKNHLGELLIIFLLIFTINNFIGGVEQTINADGIGYYDYLPAIFVYDDLPLHNKSRDSILMDRIIKTNVYVAFKDKILNKYPCGTAILLFPFFTYAHLSAPIRGFENDGFSLPYQKAVYHGALFYLFFALVFIRKTLNLYSISGFDIFISQFLIVLSTSIIQYTYYDSAFSHIFSFFAISTFIFFSKSYFLSRNRAYFLGAVIFLGLIIILRQINVLIILFLPFLAGSYANLKESYLNIIIQPYLIIKGVLLFSSILFVQFLFWYIQTGYFIVDSYQEEGFIFSNPAFFKILFSYQKGLFVYTPITFLSLIGLYFLFKNKNFYLGFSWLFFFIILTYVLSSWWSWYYGASYGLRAYIDYYGIFIILLAITLKELSVIPKTFFLFLCLTTIPLNIIQTWQYKVYTLHWWDMDKDKYWKVFLRKEERFKGMVWKNKINFDDKPLSSISDIELEDIIVEPNKVEQIYSETNKNIARFERIHVVKVSFENFYSDKEDAKMELYIKNMDTDEVYYSHTIPIVHFSNKQLNVFHRGEYDFVFYPIEKGENKRIVINIHSSNNKLLLENPKIKFLRHDYY